MVRGPGLLVAFSDARHCLRHGTGEDERIIEVLISTVSEGGARPALAVLCLRYDYTLNFFFGLEWPSA